ncbi:ABC transporter ATP-binding protein [Alicyclobacillus mali (ex Roth et al. 2021)]|uniref:ABC transporter ATP-binding protein n=1 Tax=Alicyclobacillus mali (ex Roth et al. 2021) TaxID=1123961 RepID=UPI0008358356|nr:ABC transporter ATP-binding protein [Alicyclobacillus mali (ex Roth et al. 2021)]MCL6488539.1 ABC transporter ATP-binding protein [Alicyclobacillus mali (ex Roth et al. 2021)]
MEAILSVRELKKRIGNHLALSAATFSADEGSVHAILGANGSGKTTLLRVLAGLYRPDAGEIAWIGSRIAPWDQPEWRAAMALVDPVISLPTRFHLDDWGRYAARTYPRFDADRFHKLVRSLELPTDERIRRFSLGMRMQAKLALALAMRPRLLLLDEPTTGLDPVVQRQIWQWLLGEAADAGSTILLATHDLDAMERLADSATVMFKGRSVWSGQLENAKESFVKISVRTEGKHALDAEGWALTWERDSGDRWSAMVERNALPQLMAKLRDAGAEPAVLQERLPLEEWFRSLMRKEGYARDIDGTT